MAGASGDPEPTVEETFELDVPALNALAILKTSIDEVPKELLQPLRLHTRAPGIRAASLNGLLKRTISDACKALVTDCHLISESRGYINIPRLVRDVQFSMIQLQRGLSMLFDEYELFRNHNHPFAESLQPIVDAAESLKPLLDSFETSTIKPLETLLIRTVTEQVAGEQANRVQASHQLDRRYVKYLQSKGSASGHGPTGLESEVGQAPKGEVTPPLQETTTPPTQAQPFIETVKGQELDPNS